MFKHRKIFWPHHATFPYWVTWTIRNLDLTKMPFCRLGKIRQVVVGIPSMPKLGYNIKYLYLNCYIDWCFHNLKDHFCFSFIEVKSIKVAVLPSSSEKDWSHISISSRILATPRPKCVEMIFWSIIMMAAGNALISKASPASPQSSMSALMKRISFLMPFWLTVDLFP